MGLIVYNGKSSQDYSILVEHPPGYEYPEKDYEIIHVPGRNGDIVYDYDSYQNVERSYEIAFASVKEPYEVVANRVSEWLHSAKTYARLEDSYEPDYYRMALYKESNVVACLLRGAGRATVKFNCKPQRFLKSGERAIKYDKGIHTLSNPTSFKALPKIILTTTNEAQIWINGRLVKVTKPCSNLIIDSTIQDCYVDNENKNDIVSLIEFPYLKSGKNEISIGDNITKFEIIPNWWTI